MQNDESRNTNLRQLLLRMMGLCLLLMLVGGSISLSAAQGDDTSGDVAALPPKIIDVWPLPGVPLGVNDVLTVSFDWPMDADSVAEAFSITPALEGELTWTDARTMNFAPTGGWPRSQTYAVSIGTEAKSTQGVALIEAYTVNVVTTMPLAVSLVAPEDGAEEIAANSRLTVSFDRPVVPLVSTVDMADLPNPIQITPDIAGVGEWVNTSIFTFTPATFLDAATVYTVTVDESLVASDGTPLEAGYSWSFKTELPRVTYFGLLNQDSVDPETSVSITFSVPMDQTTTQEAFSLTAGNQVVTGDFSWDNDNTVLTFQPSERLDLETTYLVRLGNTARALKGDGAIRENFSGAFTTQPYPGVADTNPRNGDASVDLEYRSGISIHFKTPMKRESLENLLVIEPRPAEVTIGMESQNSPLTRSMWANFKLEYETAYTVTLKAGAEDRFGNQIAEDYVFSFTTGPLRPRAYPIVTGNIMLTSAERENTEIAIRATGKPTVDYTLYKVTPAELSFSRMAGYHDYYYYDSDESSRPWLDNPDALLREWSETYDTEGKRSVPYGAKLASEAGGKLSAGLYYVRVGAPSLYGYGEYQTVEFALAVATATVTVKRSHDEILVWVTDMASGDPVPDAPITIYRQGNVLLTGVTDSEGILRARLDLVSNVVSGDYRSSTPEEAIVVIAEDENLFGVWYSNRENVLNTTRAYIYTDRPIYRPGDTVYFKGVLRDRLDVTYSPPEVETVEVTLGRWDMITANAEVEVSDFGTFSGEFVIPANSEIGSQYINVNWGGSPFSETYCYDYGGGYEPECYDSPGNGIAITIAEFRVPEYEVSLTPAANGIIQGEPLNTLLSAAYYFGGGVSDANVEWRLEYVRGNFNPSGYRYTFYDETLQYSYSNDLISGTGVTDSSGQLLITSTETAGLNTPFPGVPLTIRTFATISDESEQGISASTRVMAHPSEVYVGIGYGNYFGKINEPYSFDLLALTPDRVPVANQRIELEVVETRWEQFVNEWGGYDWEEKIYPVTTGEATTDAEGKATFTFTPEKGGSFRLRAVTYDDQERVNSSARRVYVPSTERITWGRSNTSSTSVGSTLTLIRDEDAYEPGDTAHIIIPVPYENGAHVLIALERAGIMSTEIIHTTEATLTYSVALTDADAPNVFVTAWMIAGPDETAPAGDPASYPRYASGSTNLLVEPSAKRLTVELTPSEELVAPGEKLTFDVLVTNREGQPVEAEIGLKLTDEAILDLLPDNAQDLFSTFYSQQGLNVTTSTSMSVLMDALLDAILPSDGMGGGGSPGGGGLANFDIRDDYKATPLWAPHVVTNSEGRATIEVTMPDNLTRWVADARVVTKDTSLGVVETTVTSTLPLIVRPAVPRFFVVGDRTELVSVINNNTGEEQVITARLESTGVTLEDPQEQQVTIPAGSRGRVAWTAIVQDVQAVDLTFFASNPDGTQTDAAKPPLTTGPNGTIPVYRYTAPDVVGTGGFLGEAGAVTEVVSLPRRVLDTASGEFVVTVDPSLAVTTVDALQYLEAFEHECIEQTVSRFLPNTVTYSALVKLGIDDANMRSNLTRLSRDAVAILLEAQNSDGGVGWFRQMKSNTYTSSYALLGMVELQESGLLDELVFEDGSIRNSVNSGNPGLMMRALADFVRRQLRAVNVGTDTWELNQQAFLLYVLARYDAMLAATGEITIDAAYITRLNNLFEQRARLPHEAQAFLLMSYGAVAPEDNAVQVLIADLTTSVFLSANGAHWEDTERDYYGWGTTTRTTALILNALTLTQPENPILPNVVRWLMVARERRHWKTTQETSWSVMALVNWMAYTGELNGNYEFAARFNQQIIAEGQVTPDTVRDQQVLTVNIRDLLLEELSTLTLARGEGEGALYYTAYLNLNLLAEEVEGVNRGIGVTREYFNDAGELISEATAGDTITVRLTLNLPHSVTYFVMNDPLPAGLESIDSQLLTNVGSTGPKLTRDNERWYWRYWAFDRTELRDDRTSLYAETLSRGTYVYTYQARAVTPGVYQTRPTHAYEFYFPEVFGRTDGQTFTVNERTEAQ